MSPSLRTVFVVAALFMVIKYHRGYTSQLPFDVAVSILVRRVAVTFRLTLDTRWCHSSGVPKNPDEVAVTVRFPKDVHAAAAAASVEEERSLNQVLVRAVRKGLGMPGPTKDSKKGGRP